MRETIVGVATPPGDGALGVLRLSGAGALSAAGGFISPGGLEPRRATKVLANSAGESIDECVAVYFPAAGSPTGEDLVEICCHGSPYIVERLVSAALNCGARQAMPGEFTERAFLNGKMDLAQAEAVCDLIAARTQESHKAALSQLAGGLSKEIARLREAILELLVRIEANLDHPEEDIPSMSAEEFAKSCARCAEGISRLASTHQRGRLVHGGAKIAIVGRPNAGKSSLLNALLGRDRAIVCPEPGTTRDTLEEPADLKGLRAVLIDTAGLRDDAHDAAEKIGIERAERALEAADFALLVIDGSREVSDEDRRLHDRIVRRGRGLLSVLSKSDLGSRGGDFPQDSIRVSSISGEGLELLTAKIKHALGAKEAREPILVTSVRHHQALLRARSEIEEAANTAAESRWEDRAASRLRQSLRALDEITGPAAGDEVLAQIFSKFCVGK